MKRKYAVLLGLVVATPAAANAQGQLPQLPGFPTGVVCDAPGSSPGQFAGVFALALANGVCADLSGFISLGRLPGIFNLSVPTFLLGTSVINNLNAELDGDPFINFSGATNNTVAGPTTYTFFFGVPIVPANYGSATSSGSVTLTAGLGTATLNNSSTSPAGVITGFGTNGLIATDLGVTIGNPSLSTTSSTSSTFTPGANSFGSTFYDNLEVRVEYTQNGAGSQATFSGRVDIFEATVIPEPATVALVATGLVAVAGVGAARRRSR